MRMSGHVTPHGNYIWFHVIAQQYMTAHPLNVRHIDTYFSLATVQEIVGVNDSNVIAPKGLDGEGNGNRRERQCLFV